jgi:queuine tRNA-ribosyltransferase
VDPLRPRFELLARSGGARRGRFATRHGPLETPAFLPVATHGAVRGLAPHDLRALGVQGVLSNTYHLHLRPGESRIAALGGLHRFMGWDGPILTDSGGFQVHSLGHLSQRSEQGVDFRDPVDGSRHFLSPERSVEIQQALGADLIAALDVFDAPAAQAGETAEARALMERTLRWARRSREAHSRQDQLLFGIVQGGGSPRLRAESAARTLELGFEAFAVGGLGLGETPALRSQLLDACISELPGGAPRYLMGLGHPDDLIEAAARGVDVFDCVVPTRHGRHGHAFTRGGVINLRNARFRDDERPLDGESADPVSAGLSRAYLHHLFKAGEALGQRLLSQHNLAFYMNLMRELRASIEAERFPAWSAAWLARYREGSESASDATQSAARAGSWSPS